MTNGSICFNKKKCFPPTEKQLRSARSVLVEKRSPVEERELLSGRRWTSCLLPVSWGLGRSAAGVYSGRIEYVNVCSVMAEVLEDLRSPRPPPPSANPPPPPLVLWPTALTNSGHQKLSEVCRRPRRRLLTPRSSERSDAQENFKWVTYTHRHTLTHTHLWKHTLLSSHARGPKEVRRQNFIITYLQVFKKPCFSLQSEQVEAWFTHWSEDVRKQTLIIFRKHWFIGPI